MKHSPNLLALAIALIGLPGIVWAQDEAQLPTVTVEGEQLPARGVFHATDVTAKDIQKNHAVDLKTALKDIPGVEVVGAQGTRQGNDSVNIRGLSGNRVAMTLDGIDLPEAMETKFWTTQGMVFGRGDFIETAALSKVEIERNAKANGLGGSVAMQTLSPTELLNGQSLGGYVESAYNSVDKSTLLSGAGAMQAGAWRGMVLGTYRKGHETDNRGDVDTVGSTRTQADPQDHNSRYVLTKHELDLNDQHTLSLAAEYLNRNQWIDNLSQISAPRTRTYDTKDETERTRISFGHHYQNDENVWVQDIQTQLYWQKAQTDADRYSEGTGFSSAYYVPKGFRHQAFTNTDKVFGLNTQWQSHFQHSGWSQDWQYGADLAYHDLTSNWDSNYVYVKSKPFADSKRTDARLFANGDLHFGAWTVSPGLGANYYKLNPSSGDGYEQNAATQTIAAIQSKSKFALTPRLGLSWQINPLLVPYVQYARGFKAPSTQQLVTSFSPSFYSILGNASLKPETANNFELGLRGRSDEFEYGIAAFDNRYRNFIDFVYVDTLPGQMFTLQYKNLEKARIYGGEAYAGWKFAPHWQVKGSLAYSRGTVEDSGEKLPINSVLPLKAKLGLAYGTDSWGANVDVTHVAAKKDKDIDADSSAYNPSKQYTLVDVGAYWKPTKHLSLSAGVNNVFNQKYWNWADVAYLMPNSNSSYSQGDGSVSLNKTNADRYTAPGRNFNIGLRYTF